MELDFNENKLKNHDKKPKLYCVHHKERMPLILDFETGKMNIIQTRPVQIFEEESDNLKNEC